MRQARQDVWTGETCEWDECQTAVKLKSTAISVLKVSLRSLLKLPPWEPINLSATAVSIRCAHSRAFSQTRCLKHNTACVCCSKLVSAVHQMLASWAPPYADLLQLEMRTCGHTATAGQRKGHDSHCWMYPNRSKKIMLYCQWLLSARLHPVVDVHRLKTGQKNYTFTYDRHDWLNHVAFHGIKSRLESKAF